MLRLLHLIWSYLIVVLTSSFDVGYTVALESSRLAQNAAFFLQLTLLEPVAPTVVNENVH